MSILSVIVPATDRPETLARCRAAIESAPDPPDEVIVVDGPRDLGAAMARNLGAKRARGDVLVFIDADVVVHPDTFTRARAAFDRDGQLTALFGSYDDAPAAPGAVSVFRNLLHHNVHQHSPGPAHTFWTGLGAVRADAFAALGGFDPKTECVEDVDFGMRLAETGATIELDPKLLCTHLKAWSLAGMLRTDLLGRGVPWTKLLLRHHALMTELNLGWRHRLSALASLCGVIALAAGEPLLALWSLAALVALNKEFYALLVRREGVLRALLGVVLHVLHHLTAILAVPLGITAYLAERRTQRAPPLAYGHANGNGNGNGNGALSNGNGRVAIPALAMVANGNGHRAVRVLTPARRARDRWLLASLGATALALITALAVAVHYDMVFGFGDTPSHVLIPRRVFDNVEPSLAQLGTHWAPLFHVLELPFVWIDPLFRSGASGVIVSGAAALVTSLYLYRLALLVGASRQRAFVAAALLAASPGFAYSGVIPMLPATIMAAATANVYYLTRWAATGSGSALLGAGLALSAATLAHFDTWVLVPLELGVVVLVARRRRARAPSAVEATTLLWLLAGGYGIALFLLMNVLIYGDPLAFVASIGGGSAVRPPHGLAGLLTYPQAAWLNAGPALAVAGLLGAGLFVLARRRDALGLVPLLLFYPIAWYTLQAAISKTYISPADTLRDWENLRYGITILPALAFFTATGIRRPAVLGFAVAAIAASVVVMVAQQRVAAWEDAAGEAPSQIQMSQVGRYVAAHAHGARVLVPAHDPLIDRFELESGLPSDDFIDPTDPHALRAASERPQDLRRMGVGWIVWIGQRDDARVMHIVFGAHAKGCFWQEGGGRARVFVYTLSPSCPEEAT